MAFFLPMNLIIRSILGLVFILSGILKLYPIEPFEFEFIELGVGTFTTAPFMARILISVEILLGLLLIFNQWLAKWVLHSTAGLLILFSGYLIYQLIEKGNSGNCGCFGTIIAMTPLQALIKNVILLCMAAFLYLNNRPSQWQPIWLCIVAVVVALVLPPILNPISFKSIHASEHNMPLDLAFLPPVEASGETVDFTQGRRIVAFFSAKCQHCRNAARKLDLLDKKYDLPVVHIVMYGKDHDVQEFFFETKVNFPVIRFHDDLFFKLTGGILPSILYMEDGIVKRRWVSELFDNKEFEALATPSIANDPEQ